ncbi:DNA-binding protein (plasmid) [Methylomonas sp. MS20]|uniref:DNA-binding protein n=1 Tax=Methylomonas sp. MS20 TaxID=3418769 RepID=UPI003D005B78
MRKQSDTYAQAYECCDIVLMEDGRFPTIEAIRDRIGVNSPTVISRAIKDWTVHFVDKHRQAFERPDMPAVLVDAATSLWQLALKEADKTFDEQRQAFEQNAASDRALVAELQQQLAAQQAQWAAERAQLNQHNAELRQANTELSTSLADARLSISQTTAELATTREALSRAEGSLTAANAALQAQEASWSDRFEQQHGWHLNRIEQEKDAARQEHARTIATLERAAEESRLERATAQARITQLMQQLGERHAHQLKWEADLAQLREQLALREAELQAEKDKTRKLQELVKKQRRPVSSAPDKAAG